MKALEPHDDGEPITRPDVERVNRWRSPVPRHPSVHRGISSPVPARHRPQTLTIDVRDGAKRSRAGPPGLRQLAELHARHHPPRMRPWEFGRPGQRASSRPFEPRPEYEIGRISFHELPVPSLARYVLGGFQRERVNHRRHHGWPDSDHERARANRADDPRPAAYPDLVPSRRQPLLRRHLRSVVGELTQPAAEVADVGHGDSPSPRRDSRSARSIRSFRSARDDWLFTLPIEQPKTSAVSASDRSSRKRNTMTARCRGGSLPRAAIRPARSSTWPCSPARPLSGSSSVGVSPRHLRRHQDVYVLIMTRRTYASGSPSTIRDQCGQTFAYVVCTRSWARWWSRVRRQAMRCSRRDLATTKSSNDG